MKKNNSKNKKNKSKILLKQSVSLGLGVLMVGSTVPMNSFAQIQVGPATENKTEIELTFPERNDLSVINDETGVKYLDNVWDIHLTKEYDGTFLANSVDDNGVRFRPNFLINGRPMSDFPDLKLEYEYHYDMTDIGGHKFRLNKIRIKEESRNKYKFKIPERQEMNDSRTFSEYEITQVDGESLGWDGIGLNEAIKKRNLTYENLQFDALNKTKPTFDLTTNVESLKPDIAKLQKEYDYKYEDGKVKISNIRLTHPEGHDYYTMADFEVPDGLVQITPTLKLSPSSTMLKLYDGDTPINPDDIIEAKYKLNDGEFKDFNKNVNLKEFSNEIRGNTSVTLKIKVRGRNYGKADGTIEKQYIIDNEEQDRREPAMTYMDELHLGDLVNNSEIYEFYDNYSPDKFGTANEARFDEARRMKLEDNTILPAGSHIISTRLKDEREIDGKFPLEYKIKVNVKPYSVNVESATYDEAIDKVTLKLASTGDEALDAEIKKLETEVTDKEKNENEVIVRDGRFVNNGGNSSNFEIHHFEPIHIRLKKQKDIEATISGNKYGDELNINKTNADDTRTYTYVYKNSNKEVIEKPTLPGNYKVEITAAENDQFRGATKEVDFTIAKRELTATITAENKTYDGTDAPTSIRGEISGLGTNANINFTNLNEAFRFDGIGVGTHKLVHTENPVLTIDGVNYKANDEIPNYTVKFVLPESVSIIKATKQMPEVALTHPRDKKANGRIYKLTTDMEFSRDGNTYEPITGDEITGLAEGTYYVRYKANENYEASPATEIRLINEARGAKLEFFGPKGERTVKNGIIGDVFNFKLVEDLENIDDYDFLGWFVNEKPLDKTAELEGPMKIVGKYKKKMRDLTLHVDVIDREYEKGNRKFEYTYEIGNLRPGDHVSLKDDIELPSDEVGTYDITITKDMLTGDTEFYNLAPTKFKVTIQKKKVVLVDSGTQTDLSTPSEPKKETKDSDTQTDNATPSDAKKAETTDSDTQTDDDEYLKELEKARKLAKEIIDKLRYLKDVDKNGYKDDIDTSITESEIRDKVKEAIDKDLMNAKAYGLEEIGHLRYISSVHKEEAKIAIENAKNVKTVEDAVNTAKRNDLLDAKIKGIEEATGLGKLSKYKSLIEEANSVDELDKILNGMRNEKEEVKKDDRNKSRHLSGSYSGSGHSISTFKSVPVNTKSNNDGINGTWINHKNEFTKDGKRTLWSFDLSNGSKIKEGWYYLHNPYASKENGQVEYSWYHFSNSRLDTGWFTDNNGLVYFLHNVNDNVQGNMYKGWHWIKGEDGKERCYYFETEQGKNQGHLYMKNITPDGYTVNEKGAWTINGKEVTR